MHAMMISNHIIHGNYIGTSKLCFNMVFFNESFSNKKTCLYYSWKAAEIFLFPKWNKLYVIIGSSFLLVFVLFISEANLVSGFYVEKLKKWF